MNTYIYNAPVPNPLKRRYSTFVSFPMNVEKMREGAAYLLGEHDFVSFCNVRTSVEDTVRTVKRIKDRSRKGRILPYGLQEMDPSIIWFGLSQAL